MIPLPKGFKLPQGMSMKDAQRAMQASAECARLVDQLLKDPDHSNLITLFILENSESYPVLAAGILDNP